jgi:hypothetical protein
MLGLFTTAHGGFGGRMLGWGALCRKMVKIFPQIGIV